VDRFGRIHTENGGQDHQGHDWPVAEGTAIKAVAPGKIVRVKSYTIPSGSCQWESLPGYNPKQKEVYIRHTVTAAGVTEQFITGYFHMKSYGPGIEPGMPETSVSRGQVIGYAGSTGCSTTDHLHFQVHRMHNTVSALSWPITSPYSRAEISDVPLVDSYGWALTCNNHTDCVDPWAQVHPSGGFSVNFWKSGETPNNPNW
jgi:murein DD-endopeptidase MepM/ murein hydrolase activator NlpD